MVERKKSQSTFRCPIVSVGACPLCSLLAQPSEGRLFHVVKRAPGTIMLRREATIEHVFQIQSGRVKVSVADASGTERTATMRGPGSILGLEALLGLPALLDARVEIEGEFAMAEPAAVERWLQSAGVPVSSIVKHLIAENVLLTTERLLLDGNAEARTARFLLERETNPFLVAWQEGARHEVAGLLSMRAETLSRAIRLLQDRHVIGPGLEILDVDALRRIAKEDGDGDER
jgi:CRP/FNR family transcriptional regulator